MPFISYAQNFDDVILYRALKGVTEGFYIDMGAHHPQEYSVTQAFYQRGWRGINIEPVPASFILLQAARRRDTNLKIAASNQAGTAQLFVTPDSSLSTFQPREALRGRSMEVDTLTLNQVLLEHPLPAIHFLKIDVEGAEKAVLEGINPDLHRPWIILVEAVKPTTSIPDHHAWEPLITAHRYDYVYFDGINRFYLAQEHRHLRDAFALPPKLFRPFHLGRVGRGPLPTNPVAMGAGSRLPASWPQEAAAPLIAQFRTRPQIPSHKPLRVGATPAQPR